MIRPNIVDGPNGSTENASSSEDQKKKCGGQRILRVLTKTIPGVVCEVTFSPGKSGFMKSKSLWWCRGSMQIKHHETDTLIVSLAVIYSDYCHAMRIARAVPMDWQQDSDTYWITERCVEHNEDEEDIVIPVHRMSSHFTMRMEIPKNEEELNTLIQRSEEMISRVRSLAWEVSVNTA